MDTVTALTMEFVRNLSKAIRTLRAYSPEHRQSQAALSDAFGTLRRMLEAIPSVLLGTKEGSLIVQGKPLHEAGPAAQGFCEMLASRNIATFAMEKGTTQEEFNHLVKILSMSPEDLLEANAIKPEHLKPLRNIRLNELRFVAVKEGTPEGEAAALLAGGPAIGNLKVLLDSLLAGGPGIAEGGGAVQLQALGAAMQPLAGGAQEDEAIQVASRHFDQIVEQCMANVPASQFIDEYLKGVGALPEAAKRAILEATGAQERAGDPNAMIGRLPLAMRGRIVAEDIHRGGTDPAHLRQVLQRLASSPGEYIQLMEIVSRLVAESASSVHEAERQAADLKNLLPLSDELKVRRPSALLIVRDREALASYARALEEAGFAVTACRRPDMNLGALVQSRALDCLVIDISPYRMNQLDFLGEVQKAPSPPPLALIEDVLTVRNPSEMGLCSQGNVLYKPLEPQKLVQALQEMVPAAREKLPPPPPAEEIESARQIQRELVPRELPAIPGYSLAARFEPGSGEEGNYHDVLPLPGRRYGLFMLDVAGNRAATLAALLTVRSELQRIFLHAGGPAEVLAALNDRLAGAVPRGTFGRAVCAVLDSASGQLAVAAGGHPRPMRWSREAPNVRLLQTAGAPLGLVKGADFRNTLRHAAVTLAPGDHVIFHTLGVTHAANAKEEELGERGVARAMLAAPDGPAGLALVEVVEAVLLHRADAAAADFTVLELRREAVPEASAAS